MDNIEMTWSVFRPRGRHMTHIIDDLRDLADVNRSDISRTEIDLSVLGREIMDDLSVLVPDREVRVRGGAWNQGPW